MDPELMKVRKRLKADFKFYAKHALKIRTKEGEIKPLVLNAAQKILLDAILDDLATREYVRIIILKGRQQGLSTMVEGFLYWQVSQREATKALVVAHKADSTAALFDMTKRYHKECPTILRPSTQYSSKRELSFDVLDSKFIVATAGGDDIARGETLQLLHCSELAFWSKTTAKEIFNGLENCVPNVRDTALFIESTANGISGLFYDLWQGAVDGTNDYRPVFIPWFLEPGYATEPKATLEKTPEELKLVKAYGLTDAQLNWRRHRVAKHGLELFKQEYPCTPQEAFLTSGRPVFDSQQLAEMIAEAHPPLFRRALEGEEFVDHPRGELLLWEEINPASTYYIGADVSLGLRDKKSDWSVAQIYDQNKAQVGKWRGQVHPDYFATILYRLGMTFNTAHIAVENNNHGLLTCHILAKDLNYPNFYQAVQHDKITDKETVTLGFSTNVKTKPMIIDELRAAVRDGDITIKDKGTMKEMQEFIVTESGKMEAEQGCHDDSVMSLAILNHNHDGKFTPVVNSDSFYVEMV